MDHGMRSHDGDLEQFVSPHRPRAITPSFPKFGCLSFLGIWFPTPSRVPMNSHYGDLILHPIIAPFPIVPHHGM